VQDALGRAWERLDRGEVFHALDRWVLTVALNQVRSRFRRQRRELLVERVSESGRDADDAAAVIDLARVLARLPDRQRSSVVLHYYLDLSVADAAEVLGVTPGTVKTSLFRARATLADALDGHG
jgi:RNA polymerase sigma-70 factor (ECF subfamily)